MICGPIDTEGPRFHVATLEGFPINPTGLTAGNQRPVLIAVVIDSFYGTEHGRYASNDTWRRLVPWKREGEWVSSLPGRFGKRYQRGREATLRATAERCAELNAWHERKGWDEGA